MTIETDESDGSFLKIPFTYAIITNIDSEYLDYYKSLNNLKINFLNFLKKFLPWEKHSYALMIKTLKIFLNKTKNKKFLYLWSSKKLIFKY